MITFSVILFLCFGWKVLMSFSPVTTRPTQFYGKMDHATRWERWSNGFFQYRSTWFAMKTIAAHYRSSMNPSNDCSPRDLSMKRIFVVLDELGLKFNQLVDCNDWRRWKCHLTLIEQWNNGFVYIKGDEDLFYSIELETLELFIGLDHSIPEQYVRRHCFRLDHSSIMNFSAAIPSRATWTKR